MDRHQQGDGHPVGDHGPSCQPAVVHQAEPKDDEKTDAEGHYLAGGRPLIPGDAPCHFGATGGAEDEHRADDHQTQYRDPQGPQDRCLGAPILEGERGHGFRALS
jgi:hypothetical protein